MNRVNIRHRGNEWIIFNVFFGWLSVDPAFQHDVFPLYDKTCFFYLLVENLIFLKDLESPLIFVLFLKEKQNKKKNPKCDSLFGQDGLRKIKSGLEGQVTYWEGTIKTITPL